MDAALRGAPEGRQQPSLAARGDTWKDSPSVGLTLVLSLLLLAVALVVAPEHPEAQEAICQRHAGVEACRVW